MSAIQLDTLIPNNIRAQIKGALLRNYGPDDLPLLDQDILEVSLPNDMRIDVGWFPENDPKGTFVIRVFRKNRHDPVRSPIEEKSPSAVAKYVVDLTMLYGSPPPPRVMSVSWSTTGNLNLNSRLVGA